MNIEKQNGTYNNETTTLHEQIACLKMCNIEPEKTAIDWFISVLYYEPLG